MILSIILIIVLLIIDRASKILLVSYLAGKGLVTILPGFFGLYLLDGGNTGAAWGILSNATWFLSVISAVVMIFLIYLLFIKKPYSVILKAAMIFIIAGGLGNLYDRIIYGAVTDFIMFLFIEFPIFNIADCCVTVGAILAVIYLLSSKKGEPMFIVGPKNSEKKEVLNSSGAASEDQ